MVLYEMDPRLRHTLASIGGMSGYCTWWNLASYSTLIQRPHQVSSKRALGILGGCEECHDMRTNHTVPIPLCDSKANSSWYVRGVQHGNRDSKAPFVVSAIMMHFTIPIQMLWVWKASPCCDLPCGNWTKGYLQDDPFEAGAPVAASPCYDRR